MVKLFGWEFKKSDQNSEQGASNLPLAPSFVPKPDDDGGMSVPYGSVQSFVYDLGINSISNDAEIISRYRDLVLHPEVEEAVDDIVNQAIILDDKIKGPLTLNLDLLEVPDDFKGMVIQSFEKIIKLLHFNVKGYEIFRRWYIDGRLAFHIIVDKENPAYGIVELRPIDVMKLRKVREIGDLQDEDGHPVQDVVNTYYLYSENGFSGTTNNNTTMKTSSQAIKISEDSIIFVTSGIKDESNNIVLSYLNAALRPLNMLRNIEDASLIYTLARAPQRRVFRPDVTNVNPKQVETIVQRMMAMHKNTVKYNQQTGEVRDDRRWLSMQEDYWFPQRDGRGTTVDVLNGDKSFMDPDWLGTFEQKLNTALKVPTSRKSPNATFMFGQGAEITRDELKFMKFIARLRMQFSQLFLKAMKAELMLTQVVDEGEWNQIESYIMFDFTEDSYFQEMKDQEVLRQRAGTMQAISPYLGVMLSLPWAYKNVWNLNEEEIKQMVQEIQDMPLPQPPE